MSRVSVGLVSPPVWCPQLCIQHAVWCSQPLLLAHALCLHAVSLALLLLSASCVRDGRAGRKARTSTLNCDKAGVKLDKNGAVVVDEGLKTSVDNIYAVGDVIDVSPPWRRLRPCLAPLPSVP